MWRYTAKPVMLVILDARACLPLLLFVVWWAWWTFYVAVTCIALLLGDQLVRSDRARGVARLVRRLLVGPVRACGSGVATAEARN